MAEITLIHVTQDDIEKGCAQSPSNCPIARAIQRELNVIDVRVGSTVTIWDQQHRGHYQLSRNAYRFIRRVDTHKEVKPFNFYMTPV